jgi:hypothetical protein
MVIPTASRPSVAAFDAMIAGHGSGDDPRGVRRRRDGAAPPTPGDTVRLTAIDGAGIQRRSPG